MLQKVLISVVIYNKPIKSMHILKKLSNYYILDMFIYDNSKFPQLVPKIKNVNIYYEHDSNNSGVSRAYNQSYKKAKELNKELLLVLDQDSAFELTFIEEYMKKYKVFKNDFLYAPIVCDDKKTKIYSPAFMNNFVGKVQNYENFIYEEIYSLIGKSAINSGLMIPMEMFEKIGGYNEKLKLDFSDIYFIEKYKELNSKIILVDVYLKHSISGDEGKNFSREFNRFRYYCSASKEIGKSLNTFIFWSPFRRLIRLSLKYKNTKFFKIFCDYYLKGKEI
jgi:GT2 family glycosyltransferase